MYRIPIYKVQLVRDSSQSSEIKRVKTPDDAVGILQKYLQGADRENFVVLMLDAKNQVIGINTVSVGSLSSTPVHPREVFKPAILSNAAGIILCHNHPSNDPAPSKDDRKLTEKLKAAGELLGIPVVDHIIITETVKYYSFKANGELG
jgi:DNA repair protein RadC